MKANITAIVLTAAALGAGTIPSRADLQIVQTTTIDCPGMKQMLAEVPDLQRVPLIKMLSPMLTGEPWVTTTYVQGDKMRTDMGDSTVVVNADSRKSFTLNRQSSAYSIGPYDPFQKAAGDITFHVQPAPETSQMFGHKLQRYAVSMTSSVLPKATITGEIWAAGDIPAPPTPGYSGGPAAGVEREMAKVKGMPMAYSITYKNTPVGDIKVVSYATSISENKLEASVFSIPDTFHKGTTQVATATPSGGFPLGDGMPLDSMTAVTNEMATGVGNHPSGYPSGPNTASANSLQGLLQSNGGNNADVMQMLNKLMSQSGGSGGGDMSQMLNQLTGGAGGGDLTQMLSQLMGSGGAGGGANLQQLQQIGSQLQSLLNDDDN